MEGHNYQKIFEKSNIKVFKNKKYFTRFKNILFTISPAPIKPIQEKIKIYYNFKLKYSIIKENVPRLNYWNVFYESFIKSQNDSSIIKEKYLHFYSKYILRRLTQLESRYSIELDILKQEYIIYCYKKINPKKKKSLKITENNISPKNSILPTEDKEIRIIFNSTRNNITENNNKKINNCWTLNPRNSIEKELYNLKSRSSKEVVDEYIGNTNVDNILSRKVDIQLSYVKNFGQKSKQKDKFIYSDRFKFQTPSKKINYLNFNNYNKVLRRSENVYSNRNIISNYKIKDEDTKDVYYNNIDENKVYNRPPNKKSTTINNPRRHCYKTNIKIKNNTYFNSISPIKKSINNKKFFQRVWLSLPLLKGNNNLLIYDDKKGKYYQNDIINKKYYINCNDLFY